MHIRSISLKNIKSHRDRELHFVTGINVLSGINGVGKSTVFEAIGYALFGVDARDFVGNIERFITIGEKKGEVQVIFETDQGKTFRVSRGVGAGSKWLVAEKKEETFEIEDHAGAVETESRIKELLGLDSGRTLADQFKLVIGPFQNEFLGPFILKQPKKRQEAFDEILGIDAWRKTYKGTSTLQAAVKSKIEVLAAEMESKKEQTAALPEKKKELKKYSAEKETHLAELANKEKQLSEIVTQLISFDEQEKKINAVRTETEVLGNRLSDGREKITYQKKLVAEAEQAVKQLKSNTKGKEAFEAAESELKSLREKEQQRRGIEKDIVALEKEYSTLSQTLKHEEEEIQQTETRLAQEKERIQLELQNSSKNKDISQLAARLPELRKESDNIRSAQGLLAGRRTGLLEGKEKLAQGNCPFFMKQCRNIAGQAPRDVFSVKIGELDKENLDLTKRLQQISSEILAAEKAKQDLDAQKVKVNELTKQLKAIEERRSRNNDRKKLLAETETKKTEAEKKTTNRRKDLDAYKTLDAKIVQAEKIRAENQQSRDTYFANQKDAEDLKNRQESLSKMLTLFEELQNSLTIRAEEYKKLEKEYNQNRHNEVRRNKEKLVAEIAAGKQKINSIDKDRQRLEEEILKLAQLNQEIKKKEAEKKKLADKEKLVKFLRNKIFNNVSLQLSERFREEISLRADIIYRTISETDETLFWGDNYQIILRDFENGRFRERTDDQLSGGQTMSAVVALRLALLQTIGARIAFFDEPTSNLDAARRENLALAFRAIDIGREEVTDHWYDQLFLISHDVAFTEVTDQVIQLEE